MNQAARTLAALLVLAAVAVAVPGHARASTGPAISWLPIGPNNIPNAHVGDSEETNLLASGRVQAFAMSVQDPQEMFAGGGEGTGNSGPSSQAGAFSSTDGGSTWMRIDTGLTDPMVDWLWMDQSSPGIVLAATWSEGIFRTSDSGAHWTNVWSGSATTILNVGSTIFAGVSQGVIASTDDGATWTTVDPTPSPVRTMASGAGSLWAGLDNGSIIYRAPSSGTWKVVLTEPACTTAYDVTGSPTDPSTAIVVEWDGCSGFGENLITSNGGSTWSTWSDPPSGGFGGSGGWAKVVLYDPQNPNVIYAGAGGGVFSSANGGASWTFLHLMEDTNMIQVIRSGSSTYLVVGGDQGLYDSTDGGASWHPLTSTIDSGLLTGLAVNGSEVLTAVQDFSPESSFDGGSTWDQLTGPAPPYCEDGVVDVNPYDSNLQYVWNGCGFQYSTDGGHTFAHATTLSPGEWTFNGDEDYLAFASVNLLYAVAKDGVYQSNDAGVTWQKTPWGFVNPSLVVVDPTNSGTIFVGTWPTGGCCSSQSTLYVSHDHGSTWSKANLGAAVGWPTSLAVDPTNPAVVLLGFSTSFSQGGGVFVSLDGGSTFNSSNTGLDDSYPFISGPGFITDITFSADGALAMVATSDGLYATQTVGSTWVNVSGTVVPRYFDAIAITDRNIFACAYGEGVVEYPLASLESILTDYTAATTTSQPATTTSQPATTTTLAVSVPGRPAIFLSANSGGLVSISLRRPVTNGGSLITSYEYSVNGRRWKIIAKNSHGALVIGHLSRGALISLRVRVGNRVGYGQASTALRVRAK